MQTLKNLALLIGFGFLVFFAADAQGQAEEGGATAERTLLQIEYMSVQEAQNVLGSPQRAFDAFGGCKLSTDEAKALIKSAEILFENPYLIQKFLNINKDYGSSFSMLTSSTRAQDFSRIYDSELDVLHLKFIIALTGLHGKDIFVKDPLTKVYAFYMLVTKATGIEPVGFDDDMALFCQEDAKKLQHILVSSGLDISIKHFALLCLDVDGSNNIYRSVDDFNENVRISRHQK